MRKHLDPLAALGGALCWALVVLPPIIGLVVWLLTHNHIDPLWYGQL